MPKLEYPVIIEPLSQTDGGGFVALVPDLPGCMSDGETAQAALASVMDAVDAWINEARALGRPLPPPSRHLVAAECPSFERPSLPPSVSLPLWHRLIAASFQKIICAPGYSSAN
jgi:antitoxin HicB